MSSADLALVVVAHPDDEIVFFGALIRDLSRAGVRVQVICATGHFGSAQLTSTRRAEFQRACWQCGAQGRHLGFPDNAEALPVEELEAELAKVARRCDWSVVCTHGVWGEYGHRHHRDTCLAVHRVFGRRVLSLAGPFAPERSITLSSSEFEAKRRIAAGAYLSQPFAADWCSREERFARVPPEAVAVLARVANGETPQARTPMAVEIQRLACASLAAFESGSFAFAEVASIPAGIWRPAHDLFAQRLRAFVTAGPSQ